MSGIHIDPYSRIGRRTTQKLRHDAPTLAWFDRIADAPEALPRLRRFILDLAVRGKLVEQEAADEPADKLLDRIKNEKTRLIKKGDIRQKAAIADVECEEVPFGLPSGWVWARLGDVIQLVGGQHLQPGEYSENKASGPPYITGPSDFGDNGLIISRYAVVRKAFAKKGQILLTVKGSGVGKSVICDLDEVAISRQLMAVTPILWNPLFLIHIMNRLTDTLKAVARSLIPGISQEDVELFQFALPPLAEQSRIVAKVDELMALCDKFEAAQAEREASRSRLTAASLARLNQPAEEPAFQENVQFHLRHFPRLTTRPEQIRDLRQTILNLAVQGKLVPQDAAEEPVVDLAKRIQAEKARQIRAGIIRDKYDLPPVSTEDQPYEIPANWSWIRFGDVILDSDAGWSPRTEGFPKSGDNWGVIKVSAVSWGTFLPDENKQLLPGTIPPKTALIRKGDFLITRANTSDLVAKCVIVDQEPVKLTLLIVISSTSVDVVAAWPLSRS